MVNCLHLLMQVGSMEQAFGFFVIVWIILGAVGTGVFILTRDAAFKRKHFPWFAILMGVIFGSFLLIVSRGEHVLFVLPFLALIVFLQIRTISFCDGCGRTIHPPNGFTRAAFCPSCG